MNINWHSIFVPLVNWYDRKMGNIPDVPRTTRNKAMIMPDDMVKGLRVIAKERYANQKNMAK